MRLLLRVLDSARASATLPAAFEEVKLLGKGGSFAYLVDDLFTNLLPELRTSSRLADEATKALIDETQRWLLRPVKGNEPAATCVPLPEPLMATVTEAVSKFQVPDELWGTFRRIIESRIRPLRTCVFRARQVITPDKTGHVVFAVLKEVLEPAHGYLEAVQRPLEMIVRKAALIDDQVCTARFVCITVNNPFKVAVAVDELLTLGGLVSCRSGRRKPGCTNCSHSSPTNRVAACPRRVALSARLRRLGLLVARTSSVC